MDIANLCGTTAPDAMAACVPNEIQPDISAPLIAPQMAPTLLLHGTNIPKVNTPNVVPAAMADNEVATWNQKKKTNHEQHSFDFNRTNFLLISIEQISFNCNRKNQILIVEENGRKPQWTLDLKFNSKQGFPFMFCLKLDVHSTHLQNAAKFFNNEQKNER